MTDPREEFLDGVDFKNIEIKEYPKIAFLCGGSPEIAHIKESDKEKEVYFSVRSYISKLLISRHNNLRFRNAEDVKDWNSYSAYDDLIDFEKDIAHICSTIVLFVESAGSIAELGSFAIIPEISQKLLVFVHQDYSSSSSFIFLGPLKKISDLGLNNVHYIKWKYEKKVVNGSRCEILAEGSMEDWDAYACNEIKESLEAKSRANRSSEEYVRTKEALFIHDIVGLFKAVTEEEILSYFKLVKHTADKKSISRSLFCLVKLDLIKTVTKGNKPFFIPINSSFKRYISLTSSNDTARLALQLSQYYQHASQLGRRDAIAETSGS